MGDDIVQISDYWTSPKIVNLAAQPTSTEGYQLHFPLHHGKVNHAYFSHCFSNLKCVGPKLVPFFKTVAIYFVLAIQRENPSWFSCLLKCLPVVWLCVFVLLHGISLGEKHAYSRKILVGLMFSCIGDALLVWPCCFLWGMLSFAVTHVLYISAFGMHPLNLQAGGVCSVLAALSYYVFYPGLYGPYKVAVPIYIILLTLMIWRAVARVQLFEDLWTWTKLCSCGGGILFALSDTLIGVRKFCSHLSPPYIQTLIMVTYYAAQLGVALSVVDSGTIAVISAAHTNPNNNNCCTLLKDPRSNSRIRLKNGLTQAASWVTALSTNPAAKSLAKND